MQVKKIKCRDCGTVFEMSEKEQQWFEDKNFDLPTRCKPCRAKRRAMKNNVKEVGR